MSYADTYYRKLYPEGTAFEPKLDGGMDQFLQAKGDINQTRIDNINNLAYLRNPQKTTMLKDLERDYGVPSDEGLSDTDRRNTLMPLVYQKRTASSRDLLQAKLHDAGFTDLYVYDNYPISDPRPFATSSSLCVCGNQAACCGNEQAIASKYGGQLVVNGSLTKLVPRRASVCGSQYAMCGVQEAVAGYFDSYIYQELDYSLPTDSDYWGFVFFVGGDTVTYNLDGTIQAISYANLDVRRKQTLEFLLMKFKPAHTWAVMFINYIN